MSENSSVSVETLYSEAAEMFRHYSNCSLTIRLSVVIQGLAIVSACGYLFQADRFMYSFLAALFGLYFTGVLFGVYWAYDKAIGSFHEVLKAIETGQAKPEGILPFSAFEAMRNSSYNRRFVSRLITLYGAFVSVGLAFIIIAIYSLARWK